ncbi:MAG: FMN-binding negative transcriptional regulator [Pseudomonadota bacterium]
MYTPSAFGESDPAVHASLIREHPLATVITVGGAAPDAFHLPLVLNREAGPLGVLEGHLPRANPVSQQAAGGIAALAVFQGPQGYISPAWYPGKRAHGRVVPTWNYAVVHVRGVLRTIDDPAWVRAQLDALTRQQEADAAEPWQVSDAPAPFTDRQLEALVGLELRIESSVGKWKMSQNRSAADQQGVIDGLEARGDSTSLELAGLVARRSGQRS